MGKCTASGYSQPNISICDNCFHRDVCGEKDYLTEDSCCSHVDQGLLVRLPCKVGDRVYEVTWANKIIPHEIVSILLSQFHLRYNLANGESFRNVAIEREIFLTREEAEAALREGTT